MVLLSTSLSSLSSSLCQDPKRIWGTKDLRQSGSLLNPKSLFLFNESSNLGYLPYLACGGVRPFSRTPGRCRDVPLVKQCASGYCHPTKSSTGIMRKGQLQNFIALLNKVNKRNPLTLDLKIHSLHFPAVKTSAFVRFIAYCISAKEMRGAFQQQQHQEQQHTDIYLILHTLCIPNFRITLDEAQLPS